MEWFHAVSQDNVEAIRRHVREALCIESLHPLRQTTALAEATRRGQSEVATLLLQLGAAPDFLCGTRATTPLHLAMQNQDWALLKTMLEATSNCAKCDAQGRNLLHLLAVAIVHQNDEAKALHIAEIIIARGIPLDALDNEGITALHYAIINDSEMLAELLLMRGANPNLRAAETGITPLIIAALESNRALAKLLLHYKADATIAMQDGTSALTIMPKLAEDIPEEMHADIVPLHTKTSTKSKSAKKQSNE